MERLTKRLASGAADYNYPTNCYFDDDSGPDRIAQSAFRQLCVERLAEYEDSKLSPEQAVTAKLIIEAAFANDTHKAERIRELLKADEEGRLVMLPSNKALTNADCMRTATNQQLAKQIYDNQKEFCKILYKNLGFEDELTFSEDYSDILAWLNAPAKMGVGYEVTKDG